MQLKKSKFKHVYRSQGKTNLSDYIGKKGVYLIKHKGKIVYIGQSGSNLYKTITRHFQSWNDRSQIRITYPQSKAYTIRVVLTRTAKQAAKLERALILKLKPKDNPQKLTLYSDKEEVEVDKFFQEYKKAPF